MSQYRRDYVVSADYTLRKFELKSQTQSHQIFYERLFAADRILLDDIPSALDSVAEKEWRSA
jgi:hypothetical protein